MEFAALGLERMDLWARALLGALRHEQRISIPGALEIERPGEADPKKQVLSDPGEVRAFFARHGGAKHVERR